MNTTVRSISNPWRLPISKRLEIALQWIPANVETLDVESLAFLAYLTGISFEFFYPKPGQRSVDFKINEPYLPERLMVPRERAEALGALWNALQKRAKDLLLYCLDHDPTGSNEYGWRFHALPTLRTAERHSLQLRASYVRDALRSLPFDIPQRGVSKSLRIVRELQTGDLRYAGYIAPGYEDYVSVAFLEDDQLTEDEAHNRAVCRKHVALRLLREKVTRLDVPKPVAPEGGFVHMARAAFAPHDLPYSLLREVLDAFDYPPVITIEGRLQQIVKGPLTAKQRRVSRKVAAWRAAHRPRGSGPDACPEDESPH